MEWKKKQWLKRWKSEDYILIFWVGVSFFFPLTLSLNLFCFFLFRPYLLSNPLFSLFFFVSSCLFLCLFFDLSALFIHSHFFTIWIYFEFLTSANFLRWFSGIVDNLPKFFSVLFFIWLKLYQSAVLPIYTRIRSLYK